MAGQKQTAAPAAHTWTADQWTASASAYFTGARSRRRAGQVRRVHLIPPAGQFPRRCVVTAACGQPWWDTDTAPNQTVPLGQPLPDGLTWCPKCLGIAAEQLGLTDQVAELITRALG